MRCRAAQRRNEAGIFASLVWILTIVESLRGESMPGNTPKKDVDFYAENKIYIFSLDNLEGALDNSFFVKVRPFDEKSSI
jgi:hypothetical protein